MTQKLQFKIKPIPTNIKNGAIHYENGKIIKQHELETIKKLICFGFDVVCKLESNVPYEHTADIVWKNELWELKSITGTSSYTINNNLRKAKRQSSNIIIDITFSAIHLHSAINHCVDTMKKSKRIKKIILINKSEYCIIERNLLI